jgi:hypothetical protein
MFAATRYPGILASLISLLAGTSLSNRADLSLAIIPVQLIAELHVNPASPSP